MQAVAPSSRHEIEISIQVTFDMHRKSRFSMHVTRTWEVFTETGHFSDR